MTYCVGLYLNQGLVLLSDTRTNAGVDHISTFSKMHVEEVPGERMICLLSSGNLAISQQVWSRLQEGVWLDGERQTLRDVPTMFRAAQLVGAAVRAVFDADGPTLRAQGIGFDVAPAARRADHRPADAPVHDLRRRQLHRSHRGHALPADRRAQIRQAHPRPRR